MQVIEMTSTHQPASRFAFLDALRGLAAISIMGYHAYRYEPAPQASEVFLPFLVEQWLQYGWIGVQFLLVISGFVIAYSFRGGEVRTAALFVLSLFFLGAGPREVTGIEWLEASSRERTESLARSMYALEKSGVELSSGPLEYYDDLHSWIRHHPADYDKGLTRLLAGRVYEKEPGQREALRRMGYRP